jgi:hypothetical protein
MLRTDTETHIASYAFRHGFVAGAGVGTTDESRPMPPNQSIPEAFWAEHWRAGYHAGRDAIAKAWSTYVFEQTVT